MSPIKHSFEVVEPYKLMLDNDTIQYTERHKLTIGSLTTHSTSLAECERLMNIRVHAA